MATQNRVWIELVHPSENKELADQAARTAFAREQCRLANNMLSRLIKDEDRQGYAFHWSEHQNRYTYGNVMGEKTLVDHGEWFSLDYLGRPLEEEQAAG